MSNPGYDPCECVWSHEMAMRRLISLLRSSQGYCTSDECFQDLPGPANANVPRSVDGNDSYFFFMMLWVVFAIFLFLMRPGLIFKKDNAKPFNNQGPRQPPPDSAIM